MEDEIEHFLHAPGMQPKIGRASADETLGEIIIRYEVLKDPQSDVFVFVGECVEALEEVDNMEDGVDEHVTVDISLSLAVLEIERQRHVHAHTCRHIAVGVNFGGQDQAAQIFAEHDGWRRHGMGAPKIPFRPGGSRRICPFGLQQHPLKPRSTKHLGDLVDGKTCSLCFDLVKELTPKG